MRDPIELSIIVPAYNEARNLPSLLQELRQLNGWSTEVIVVDDGSQDRTAEVAEASGARLVRLARNQGKGAALRAGFEVSRGTYLVQIDADRQFLVQEIERLVEPLTRGAQIVFGSRFVRGSSLEAGSMAWTNAVAHRVLCLAGWVASGIRVHDVMAGFKAFRRDCALQLDLRTSHFGYESEILVRAGQLGLRVVEVPVTFLRRPHGRSNVKKVRDGCRVLATIAATAWRGRLRRPIRSAASALPTRDERCSASKAPSDHGDMDHAARDHHAHDDLLYDTDLYVTQPDVAWINHRRVRFGLELLARVAASGRPLRRIADLGCGQGYMTVQVAEAFPEAQIEAFDVSRPRLQAAQPHARVAYKVGDARAVPVSPETYDLAIVWSVLTHIKETGQVTAELRRVVRPGGYLLLQQGLCWTREVLSTPDQCGHHHRFTGGSLLRLLRASGFRILAVRGNGFPSQWTRWSWTPLRSPYGLCVKYARPWARVLNGFGRVCPRRAFDLTVLAQRP